MDTEKLSKLTEIYGPIEQTIGPSGKQFWIREQNGSDDDLLSSSVMSRNQTNLNAFISSIVVWTDAFEGNNITLNNIERLLIKDKYFILFMSRIYSIGKLIKFTYDWGMDNGGKVDYTEDLSQYLWDHDETGDTFKYRMAKYDMEDPYAIQEFKTSSGKQIQFKMIDIKAENILMNKGNEITKNDDLLARETKLLVDGTYTKISNFRFFSKKDMIEIHTHISNLEKPFFGFTEIENPKDGSLEVYPLIIDPAFFFPLGI